MKPLLLHFTLILTLGMLCALHGNAGEQKRGGIRQCDHDRLQDRTNCDGATNCTRTLGTLSAQPDDSTGKNGECTNACLKSQYKIRTRLRNRVHINGGMCLSNCWENPVQARLTLRLGPVNICSNQTSWRVRRRSATYYDPENGGRVKLWGSTNGLVRMRIRYISNKPENNGLMDGSNLMHRVRCRLGSWYGESETEVHNRHRQSNPGQKHP
jgi:hypothetical protein